MLTTLVTDVNWVILRERGAVIKQCQKFLILLAALSFALDLYILIVECTLITYQFICLSIKVFILDRNIHNLRASLALLLDFLVLVIVANEWYSAISGYLPPLIVD